MKLHKHSISLRACTPTAIHKRITISAVDTASMTFQCGVTGEETVLAFVIAVHNLARMLNYAARSLYGVSIE